VNHHLSGKVDSKSFESWLSTATRSQRSITAREFSVHSAGSIVRIAHNANNPRYLKKNVIPPIQTPVVSAHPEDVFPPGHPSFVGKD
jgi:hypothetical protein